MGILFLTDLRSIWGFSMGYEGGQVLSNRFIKISIIPNKTKAPM